MYINPDLNTDKEGEPEEKGKDTEKREVEGDKEEKKREAVEKEEKHKENEVQYARINGNSHDDSP